MFNAETTCYSDILEWKKVQKYINQIKMEQEEGDGEAEDYIVDFQIPDEYRFAYRQYNSTLRIRNIYVRRFLGVISSDDSKVKETSFTGYTEKTSTNEEPPGKEVVVTSRKATTEEKYFERFLKGKVKGILNDYYVEAIGMEHYLGLVQAVIEIFDRFRKEENVEDIFSTDYVIGTKIDFYNNLLNKSAKENYMNEDFDKSIILKSLDLIVENFSFYKGIEDEELAWKLESGNRKLLTNLEKIYGIRQTYTSYMEELNLKKDSFVSTYGVNRACGYIETLYGYKNYEMVVRFIKDHYEKAEVEKNGRKISITAETEFIREHYKPNTDVIRQIANYSRNVSKITSVTIMIINKDLGSGVESIKHSVDLDNHQSYYVEQRRNGTRNMSKSQYLSY